MKPTNKFSGIGNIQNCIINLLFQKTKTETKDFRAYSRTVVFHRWVAVFMGLQLNELWIRDLDLTKQPLQNRQVA